MQTHRICSRCKENLEIIKFAPRSDRKDQVRSICRECCKIQGKLWASNNKEKRKKTSHEHYMKDPDKYKLYSRNWRKSNPLKKLLQGATERAKQNNLPMDITIDGLIMPEFCPILGLKLCVNSGGGKPSENSPSLDRIDSTKGYIKGNVAIISFRANAIKNDGTIEEHQKVIDYMKSKLS